MGDATLHRLTIASTLAETGRLHDWLDGVLAPAPAAIGHAARLCLEEAVMNVVLHGYGPGRPGEVEVDVRLHPGGVTAVVADRAPAFDPTLAAPRPASKALDDGSVGGRGLGLLRRYARLRYEWRDGQNRLTMDIPA